MLLYVRKYNATGMHGEAPTTFLFQRFQRRGIYVLTPHRTNGCNEADALKFVTRRSFGMRAPPKAH